MKKIISFLSVNFFVFLISARKGLAIVAVDFDRGARVAEVAEPYYPRVGYAPRVDIVTSFTVVTLALWVLTAIFMILVLVMKKDSSARKVLKGIFIFFFVISIIALLADIFVFR